MPSEIADSDAESEVYDEVREKDVGKPREHHAPAQELDLGVNLDDFLRSQSQHQPSQNVGHAFPPTNTSNVGSDGTTEEILVRGSKRRHSTLDYVQDGEKDFVTISAKKMSKRTKTYSGTDRENRSSHGSERRQNQLFGEQCPSISDDARRVPEPYAEESGASLLPLQDQVVRPDDLQTSMGRCSPAQPAMNSYTNSASKTNILGSSNAKSRHISTSRSSMGTYQSIQLDFRGGVGLDINANPFGNLSQVSFDSEVDEEQRAKVASFFGPTAGSPIAQTLETPFANVGMNTSPIRDEAHVVLAGKQVLRTEEPEGAPPELETPNHFNHLPGEPASWSLKAEKQGTKRTKSRASAAAIMDTENDAKSIEHEKPQGKKRGRKPKSDSALSPSFLDPAAHDDTARDDDFIGRLVETYHKKPSRSRSGIDEDSTNHSTRNGSKKEQSSPAKQPTSELNLSDEALIGLPKENYNPRPSRSRSKRIIEEEKAILEDSEPKNKKRASIDDSQALDPPPPAEQETPATKAPKKKSKIKRAKTSAKALLKGSQKMLSDGEEDVMWLETQPKMVKMDLPPEVSPEKRIKTDEAGSVQEKPPPRDHGDEAAGENEQDSGNMVPAQDDQRTERTEPQHKQITVEVPAPQEPAAAEAKKRGRKKKVPVIASDRAAEAKDVSEPSHDIDNPAAEDACAARPILAEKDANTDTHQVDKVDVGKQSDLCTEVVTEDEPAEAANHTPPKRSCRANEPDKSPSRHSPINPAGGKVKYRVGLSRRAAIAPLLRVVRKDVTR